jgi:predicted dehydrogenase
VTRRLLLVGAGRHAERIYLPVLTETARRGDVILTGVVELATRAEKVRPLVPALMTVIQDQLAGDREHVYAEITRLYRSAPFDAMLIANDPRCRQAYFDFACDHGIAVFTDKPVFAVDGIAHDPRLATIYAQQLHALDARVRAAGIEFVIQTQRRDHPGYLHIRNLVRACSDRHGLPVTSLQIQHADGMWVLADEWEREHHPYKYGFGKLFHSGYHFVDLAAFLLADTLAAHNILTVDIAAKAVMAASAPLPDTGRNMPPLDRRGYGEYDVHALLDFGPCTTQLTLLQNSFSDRDPSRKVTDPYKGTGRVRHERIDLKISTAMNIQVHSYQSSSTPEPAGNAVGQTDHYEILIFRNPSLEPGPVCERLTMDDLSSGQTQAHNEKSRISLLQKFLRHEPTGSELADYGLTGNLVSAIYAALAQHPGRIGTCSWNLTNAGR